MEDVEWLVYTLRPAVIHYLDDGLECTERDSKQGDD